MSRPGYKPEKMTDHLRAFAESAADGRLSVLIELAAKPPQVLVGERPWGQLERRALSIGKRDDKAIARRMARLEKALGAIVGETLRLDAAEAFVAEVTPAQLREITRLGDVGQVRANRRHHEG
jgi:hypothetical protein